MGTFQKRVGSLNVMSDLKSISIIALLAVSLGACSNPMKGNWDCKGGLVDSLEFVSSSKVIVKTFGVSFTTTYVATDQTINIKTDKLDYVFTRASANELRGNKYLGMLDTGNCKLIK